MKRRRKRIHAALRGLLLALAMVEGLAGAGCSHSAYGPPSSPPAVPPPPVAQNYPSAPVTPPPAPSRPQPTAARVSLGIDVLAARRFDILQGQRIGLLTNRAGVNRDGVSTIEILRRAPGVKLVALFGPEHGLSGQEPAEAYVASRMDPQLGIPVYSLYGATRYPTRDMLKDIDTMVVDLQDVGTRSYTYISCLRYTMEVCFELGKTVVVLDRPNPLGGLKVGGPIIEEKFMSYVGAYPVPYVYGLTIGELARMAKDKTDWLKVSDAVRQHGKLIVVPMSGWRRSMTWQDTGLKWVPTSPKIPDVGAAFGYNLTGLASAGGIDRFGHGDGTPFEFRLLNYPGGKPTIKPEELAALLRGLRLSGLNFAKYTYQEPDKNDPKKLVEHSGVYVQITDWNAVVPTELSFQMMRLSALWSRTGNPFAQATANQIDLFDKHVGSSAWLQELRTKGGRADVAGFFRRWNAVAAIFQQDSKRWWLYPE